MLKKLHLLVLRNYLGPFILTFFIAEFVLIMQFIWKYIDDLAGKGLEIPVILEFILYLSASIVPMALPLAILLSAIMTFGSLAENLELVACKAAGISLYRILSPLIVVSVIMAFLAFYFSNNVLPVANLKLRSLLVDIQKQRPAIDIKAGVFYEGIKDLVIRVESVSADKKTLSGIMIYDHTRFDNGNARVTIAQKGMLEVTPDENYLVLRLMDGVTYDELGFFGKPDPKLPFVKNYFSAQIIPVDLSDFKLARNSEDIYKDHYQMMTIRQLQKAINELRLQYENRAGDFGRSVRQNYFFARSTPRPLGMQTLPDNFNPLVPEPEKIRGARNGSTAVSMSSEFIPPRLFSDSEIVDKNHVVLRDTLSALRILQETASIAENGKIRAGDFLIEIRSRRETIARYASEWHRKFTLSVACIALFFIGAPLGAIIRRGGLGLPLVFSMVIFILYYVISTIGEKAAKQLTLTPFWGMWVSTLILIPFGVFLTIKAANDSKLFDRDWYIRIVNRVFKRNAA